jgi:hypothetical protein
MIFNPRPADVSIPSDEEIAAMAPERLRLERIRLRNELSFAHSQERNGGPSREAFKIECNRALRAIAARVDAGQGAMP